jgi:hypothetical protein
MLAHDSGRRSGEAEKNLRFLHDSERAFLESAVDRLIPPDEHWPGGVQAGVVNYMDLQMAGPWGRGELIYRHGPFRKGTPSQGYQLEYTPAELFRRSISAIDAHFSAHAANPQTSAGVSNGNPSTTSDAASGTSGEKLSSQKVVNELPLNPGKSKTYSRLLLILGS